MVRAQFKTNIKFNNKLYLKYILNGLKFNFIENFFNKNKNSNLLISNKALLYLTFHLRLSSLFYLNQLVDIFAYELPYSPLTPLKTSKEVVNPQTKVTSIVVYNYHSLITQDRFFIFTYNSLNTNTNLSTKSTNSLNSIAEIYYAANWLEREVFELSGINFLNKKDLRNLMLQYGDSSYPLQKIFPTVGLKELYYNPIKDTLVQTPVTLQL